MGAEAGLAAANMINQNRQQNTNTALTLGGMIFNAASQYQQNVWNERLMEKQNQWNIDQWNRENAYNTPLAQMQRLAAAGINPSLAFSNGQLMNEAAASPQMQASQGRAMSVDPLALAQARLMTAQAGQADALAEKTRAETETENQLRQARYDNLVAATANLAKQNEDIVSRIQQRVKQNELTDAEIYNLSFEQMIKNGQLNLDFQRLENENKLTAAQVKNLNADTRKKLAEAKVSEREYQEMVWTYAIRKSDLANKVNLSAAQIDQARATARKLGIEADLEAPMAEIRRKAASEIKGEKGRYNQITATAVYGLYDVISNFGRIIH